MNILFEQHISRRSILKAAGVLMPILLSPRIGLSRVINSFTSVRRQTFAMGTVISIEAFGTDRAHIEQAITKAFNVFHRIDRLMSVYSDRSDISRVNASAGRSFVAVDPDVSEVLRHAAYYSSLTNGKFDISIEPLMRLWGFRTDDIHRMPTDREISTVLESVGMQTIDRDGNQIGLVNPLSKLDLGGIAVGYSVDKAVEVLRAEGIESAFINHSGDVYAIGTPPGSDGWQCIVPHPLYPDTSIAEFILHDEAASTSSGTEKFVELGGKRFAHIIEPCTGRPSETVVSTTIISSKAIEADTLSTASFAMTLQDGLALARKTSNKIITSAYADGMLRTYRAE